MLEGLQVMSSLIQQEDLMMKLALKDRYYALPIHTSHFGSGQNMGVPMPTFPSVLSSPCLHKNIETSVGSSIFAG